MAPRKKKLTIKTSTTTASKTKDGLNMQQEAFCQLFAQGDKDLFGNGTQCYLEAYGKTDNNGKRISYQTAMVCAHKLLRNAKIVKRINELLETFGFNDVFVDRQHSFLISQYADFKTKMAAIKEYNALKGRVKSKMEPEDAANFLSFINKINAAGNKK